MKFGVVDAWNAASQVQYYYLDSTKGTIARLGPDFMYALYAVRFGPGPSVVRLNYSILLCARAADCRGTIVIWRGSDLVRCNCVTTERLAVCKMVELCAPHRGTCASTRSQVLVSNERKCVWVWVD